MRKLIHSNFELDLSIYKLSVVRENHWFSEGFFTKFSFPFELDLTNDLEALLGFISRYNSTDIKTHVECKYYHDNEIADAIFEVEQCQDKLSCVVYFGYDQLPNWDKKLSELPLQKFELPTGTSVYSHAANIITQTWPAVNYNFPQIHTDKIDPDSDDVWFAFEKIINNYKNGAFLINEVIHDDATNNDTTYNRNIMQPLPYWLHVLTKIFEDVGLTLTGEILSDPRFIKKLLYADVDYFTSITQESVSIIKKSEDKVAEGISQVFLSNGVFQNYTYYRYAFTQPIANPGRYRVIGKIHVFPAGQTVLNTCVIKYRNQIIWQNATFIFPFSTTWDVNIVFDTLVDLVPNDITIESYQGASTDQVIFEIDINPIRLHDAAGNPIPTIINKNEIDLTKSVPAMTCGDFIKVIKNWYNYGLKVEGTLAIMNKIQNQIIYADAIDLSAYEVKYPLRKFQKGLSFLLKFNDIDSKIYTFLPVFQDINAAVNASYKTTDKTQTIEVNALPLPLLVRNGIQTAHAFESNNAKPYAVLYNGVLTASLNLALDPFDILIPQVHKTNWLEWFGFRINSQEFTWPLKMFSEKFQHIREQSIIFAYNRYHIVKTINDTEVAPDEFEIQLETVSIE